MKLFRFFIGAMALAVASVATVPVVNAQEVNEVQKKVRHSYITNDLWSNWSIGVGAGVNTFLHEGLNSPKVALDVAVSKWVTPCVGVKLGYHGLNVEAVKSDYAMNYAYGEVMWNISNAIGGYKESRFWDFVPYSHWGGVWFHNETIKRDRELMLGVGLLNVLRLGKCVDLTLDLRSSMINGRVVGSGDIKGILTATVGVSVNLGNKAWERANK